jgi:hypothetical protein
VFRRDYTISGTSTSTSAMTLLIRFMSTRLLHNRQSLRRNRVSTDGAHIATYFQSRRHKTSSASPNLPRFSSQQQLPQKTILLSPLLTMATQATTWNHLLAAIPDETMSSRFPTASNDGNNYYSCREDKPYSSSTLVAAVTTSSQEAKEEHTEQEPTDMASRSSSKAKNRKTKRSGKWTVRIVFRKCFLDVLLNQPSTSS